VARQRSNVQRVRRPLTIRHAVRGLIFAAGLVGGILTAWLVVPRSDLLAFDLGLAQGAAAGALIGLCLSVMVSLPSTPKGPAKPRPSNFEAMVAALDADGAPPLDPPEDPSRASSEVGTEAGPPAATDPVDA
jgi:hypothetical protein